MGEGFIIKATGGVAVALASFLWGGLDNYMITLLAFLAIDFLTGTLYALKHREISFKKSFDGFTKKIVTLLIVAVAVRVDFMMNAGGAIRVVAIYGYIGTELYSIIENAIKLNVPIPTQLAKYFKVYAEGAGNHEGQ
jgi:toxin secretion/phage lysis holin